MTVLVTGASGFVGLAMTEALLTAGQSVVAFDTAPAPEAAQTVFATLPGALRTVLGDVRDEAALKGAMDGVDRMIIAAAVTAGQEREIAAPETVIGVNVQAVATSVRLAATAGLRRVVHLSSIAAYGATMETEGPLTEDMPLRPTALYGITKAAGEAVALRLSALGGLDLAAVRLGSCFGPWEHATGLRDTLSPQQQILIAARQGERIVLETDAVRDWLYVRDAAAGILALLNAPALPHRVYNVGSGMSWKLSDWCNALVPGLGWRVGPAPHIRTWNDRPPASIARLQADTPYRPKFDAEAAAADWLGFLQRTGAASLAARPA
jgi:UDP-glucuronate 4-epimerase